MTENARPTPEEVLAALIPAVALAAALEKKGILTAHDLYEELGMLEGRAKASGAESIAIVSEAAGDAKRLLFVAAYYAQVGSSPVQSGNGAGTNLRSTYPDPCAPARVGSKSAD